MKCVAHILRESLYCGFRPCHSVFTGGGHLFRPAVSMIISYLRGVGGLIDMPKPKYVGTDRGPPIRQILGFCRQATVIVGGLGDPRPSPRVRLLRWAKGCEGTTHLV